MIQERNLLLAVALATMLCGCAHETAHVIGAPSLDSRFGEAFARARSMQVINPSGAEVNDQGYSGKAALTAIERYYGRSVPTPSTTPAPSSVPSSAPPATTGAQSSR